MPKSSLSLTKTSDASTRSSASGETGPSANSAARSQASIYERSGLSKNKTQLAAIAHAGAETLDPYIFEFLGLRSQETMGESDLEDALLDRLQEFLLEMGHGFCFEARQKRMLIGGEHFHSFSAGGFAESAKLEAATRANLKSLNFNP